MVHLKVSFVCIEFMGVGVQFWLLQFPDGRSIEAFQFLAKRQRFFAKHSNTFFYCCLHLHAHTNKEPVNVRQVRHHQVRHQITIHIIKFGKKTPLCHYNMACAFLRPPLQTSWLLFQKQSCAIHPGANAGRSFESFFSQDVHNLQ